MAVQETKSIKQVTAYSGLSRTSLLYYESIGLLKASIRTRANYRLYNGKDLARLDRIMLYRSTGMPLNQIKNLLDQQETEMLSGFETRMRQIRIEMAELQKQQKVLFTLIKEHAQLAPEAPMTKKIWVNMLGKAGLDQQAMMQWHKDFERDSPLAHQDFLESLNITAEEIKGIRRRSQARTE